MIYAQTPVKPLLVVVGPTASGKTTLSVNLARRFDGEVVSADARLFYRGMDIGTAKPTVAEMGGVAHHLIDICEPDEDVSLAQYMRWANDAIGHIHSRDRLPILVGGTGQYVRAVVEGWSIPRVPPWPALRQALEKFDPVELHRWLSLLDSDRAEAIDYRNQRRVIRALEIIFTTGHLASQNRIKIRPNRAVKTIGLRWERELLYQRIDQRVGEMMQNGLLDEVRALREQGYGTELSSMSGIGYRQLMMHLEGKWSLEEAVERMTFDSHRLVRQQNSWFGDDDRTIEWHDAAAPTVATAIEGSVEGWIAALTVPQKSSD